MDTFEREWGQVKDEAARKAFIMAGYCAPDTPIPMEIFEKALRIDAAKCAEVLKLLQERGFLKEGPAIDPLLADYARALDQEQANLLALYDRLVDIAHYRNDDVDRTGDRSLYDPILPHVRAVAEWAESAPVNRAGDLWHSLGYHLDGLGDHEGAKIAYERAIRIVEAVCGPDCEELAVHLNNLGGVLYELGDLPGAKLAYERALRIDEVEAGSDEPSVARDLNNLGGVLEKLGDLAGAKAAYERALRILKALPPEFQPHVELVEENLKGLEGDLTGDDLLGKSRR